MPTPTNLHSEIRTEMRMDYYGQEEYKVTIIGAKRPNLAECWAKWRTQTTEADRYAKDHNLYDTSQRGTVPVEKSNAYHESLLNPDL